MTDETTLEALRWPGPIVKLKHWQAADVSRAIEVLRRISNDECTNAKSEAADILRALECR